MRKVPLVVYKDGKRNVIGEAIVSDGGMIEEATLEGVLGTSEVFGTSLEDFSISKEKQDG